LKKVQIVPKLKLKIIKPSQKTFKNPEENLLSLMYVSIISYCISIYYSLTYTLHQKLTVMKKLLNRTILFVVLLSAIFVIVSFTYSNSSEKKVLLVESYMGVGSYGVALFHNDKPTEFIEMDYKSIIEEGEGESEIIFRKMAEEKGRIISNTLQKLYDDGWKLEGTNGGDSVHRYILTK
jgi:hypothetical protein